MTHRPAWTWCGQSNRWAMAVAAPLLAAGTAAGQATTPIDLSTWNEQGFAGDWEVAADGSSVLQTTNGPPTFFISPDNFINTTLRGSFQVETTDDDDFIGFVFGYNNPLGAETTARDFLMLDWKQSEQSFSGAFADEGLTLSRVVGDIAPGPGVAGSTAEIHYFFGHPDTGPTPDADGVIFDVLGTDYGDDRGWEDGTTYEFELLYQEDRIRVALGGGQFGSGNLQTIFDIMASDVGVGAFSTGRFGFYNLSQADVRYAGFTERDTPPDVDPPPTIIPTPAALPAGLAALAILAGGRRRRDG